MGLHRFLRAATIALILVITAAAAVPNSMRAASQAQSFSAVLVPVAGLVQVLPHGSTEWTNVEEEALIRAGDQIRTDADGMARLNVVTGITVEIYPTSLVELDRLSMQDGPGELFDLKQVVGTIYADVKQVVRPNDRIQLALPTAEITIRGTQFFSFVDPDLNVGIISQEHSVEVQTADRRKFTVTPDNLLFIKFTLPRSDSAIINCTVDFLKASTSPQLVVEPLSAKPTNIQALREFLRALVRSNVNPQIRVFLRRYLGLPDVNLEDLGADDDTTELQEILDAIEALSTEEMTLPEFLSEYREYWGRTYKDALKTTLAPATCGNGRHDLAETLQNCLADFTPITSCGNGLCETNRRGIGESVLSCPADCLPMGPLALSCQTVIEGAVNPPTRPTPVGGPSGIGR